jgi:hypothetical protein
MVISLLEGGSSRGGNIGHSTCSGSDLDWLCVTMILLKVLFYDCGFFLEQKLMIYNRATTSLCTVSYLEALLLEKLDFHSGSFLLYGFFAIYIYNL